MYLKKILDCHEMRHQKKFWGSFLNDVCRQGEAKIVELWKFKVNFGANQNFKDEFIPY